MRRKQDIIHCFISLVLNEPAFSTDSYVYGTIKNSLIIATKTLRNNTIRSHVNNYLHINKIDTLKLAKEDCAQKYSADWRDCGLLRKTVVCRAPPGKRDIVSF